MNAATFVIFCYGVTVATMLGAALFFLRFWRSTHDPFFACFAGAFALLGIQWALIVAAQPDAETRPFYYLLRLAAFGLIILATIQKNRAT